MGGQWATVVAILRPPAYYLSQFGAYCSCGAPVLRTGGPAGWPALGAILQERLLATCSCALQVLKQVRPWRRSASMAGPTAQGTLHLKIIAHLPDDFACQVHPVLALSKASAGYYNFMS